MSRERRPRDPRIPSEPLLTVIPRAGDKGQAWCNRWGDDEVRPYGRKLFAAGLAKHLGVSEHQGEWWVAKIGRGDPVPLWLADEVCAFAGVPFGFVYVGVPIPEVADLASAS